MDSHDKLFDAHDLEGFTQEDKEVLTREIQHHVNSDPVVRAIMIAHKGVQGLADNDPDPVVRAMKLLGKGMKEHLRGKVKPLHDQMKSKTRTGRQPPRPK